MIRRVVLLSLSLGVFLQLAKAGTPQWVEVRSAHFTVVSDASEKQARHVLDQLERMRWVFQTLYPKVNIDPPDPILVLAAKNTKTFQSVEPAPYLAKGQLNLAGYFLQTPDQNYILLRLDAQEEQHPYATIYHEYTHLQFRGAGESLPLWLNEGIAQFFQNSQIRDKDVLVGQADVNDILFLREQRLIPLPVLFKVDATSPYYHEEAKGSIFYAESWALTHYLQVTDREKGTDRLRQYLIEVSRHQDAVAAAEKAFGDLKQLQKDLEFYIHFAQYKQFVLNSAAAPIDESTYTARPLSEQDADAVRGEILAKVQRESEARDLLNSVLKTDPGNVRALLALGTLEAQTGRPEIALGFYRQAIKADPSSAKADYEFASFSMQSGHADDEAIEPSLRAAIKNRPDFAPAYEGLASYLGMKHRNMEEAFSLIKTAIKLDPGNFYFRLNAANVLAAMNKYDDAIAVAGAAEKLARNAQQASSAESRIEQLKEFKEERADFEERQRTFSAQKEAVASTAAAAQVIPATQQLKHPTAANGPKHTITGVIHKVACSYPMVLEFEVQNGGKSYNLYSNNFTKIDLSALGFTPNDSMNPCSDFEGRNAKVQYAEADDKTVDGQVFAIELHK